MNQFEYDVVHWHTNQNGEFREKFKAMTDEGWQLIDTTSAGCHYYNTFVWTFKRPVRPATPHRGQNCEDEEEEIQESLGTSRSTTAQHAFPFQER